MGNNAGKKHDELVISEEQMTSLLANTAFSREEILKWHEGFIVSSRQNFFLNSPSLNNLFFNWPLRKIVPMVNWIRRNLWMSTKYSIHKVNANFKF